MMEKRWRISGYTRLFGRNAELSPGVPLVELVDGNRAVLENHKGILMYSSEEIRIRIRDGWISFCGKNLELSCMAKQYLILTGTIDSIQYARGNSL